jgi:hypothetical protein
MSTTDPAAAAPHPAGEAEARPVVPRRRRIPNTPEFQAGMLEAILVLRKHGFARDIPPGTLVRLGLVRRDAR